MSLWSVANFALSVKSMVFVLASSNGTSPNSTLLMYIKEVISAKEIHFSLELH